MRNKFKSNFDLVNYAISLAENMIKTGRDARVKSDVQNRAMLILEEIREGKDHFDEIESAPDSASSQWDINGVLKQPMIFEQRTEVSKYRTAESFDE